VPEELTAGERAGHSLSFTRVATEYDATRGGEERGRRHATLVAPYLDTSRWVLEVGIGTGTVAKGLAQLGFAVRGVDLSLAMLARARARLGPSLIAADAARLPLRAASVPQALSVWFLHLVGDMGAVMADVARVMVPGGRWVIIPAGGAQLADADAVTRLTRSMATAFGGPLAVSGPRPTRERLRALAMRAGFSVETLHAVEPAAFFESPEQSALNLERRVYSMCWDLDDATYERVVAPVVAALRALPNAHRPIRRTTSREVIAVLLR
jgi:SAM-dependent methyltransferase